MRILTTLFTRSDCHAEQLITTTVPVVKTLSDARNQLVFVGHLWSGSFELASEKLPVFAVHQCLEFLPIAVQQCNTNYTQDDGLFSFRKSLNR